uniref:Uncharacterized protein n=1 Tax=Alexandrium andersonii TaxID=327968 RepID=A0A7S2AJC2_9DINO|mmetsp:Transcript_12767/g.28952  ORF Transcript_12767/g.28952 Transcript_12767/m.28952 type:complete len:148 (+) Transcript_12767:224-667(+)
MGTSATAYNFAHVVQVPLVLLINGLLAWWYYRRASRTPEPGLGKYGPLALHGLGTLLVLIQPIFDEGGLITDIKKGLQTQTVTPPHFFSGGLWHHGWLMAFFQISGLLCLLFASVWSIYIHEEESIEELDPFLSKPLKDDDKEYASA